MRARRRRAQPFVDNLKINLGRSRLGAELGQPASEEGMSAGK